MARRRYYRRRYSRPKWSVERTSMRLLSPTIGDTQSLALVPADPAEGVRTVKNIKIQLCTQATTTVQTGPLTIPNHQTWDPANNLIFNWAIVYVPQGYDPQDLNLADSEDGSPIGRIASFYRANQFVIASGLLGITNEPKTVFTRLARKLHSGDAIAFVYRYINLGDQADFQTDMVALVSYAIKYN